MDSIGVSTQFNAVYEGDPNHGHRVLPPPSLTPVRFAQVGKLIPPFCEACFEFPDRIFREDGFDPVTKVRCGRIYNAQMVIQPYEWHVHDPLLQSVPEIKWGDGFARKTRLITYVRNSLRELANTPTHALPTVVLGHEPHLTYWKIISIETNLFGTPVLSLRAKHSFGDTPDLIDSQVPHEILGELIATLEKVESCANRLAPTEVIDRCRDALAIAFSYKAGDRSKDLMKAIDAYLRVIRTEDNLCSWAGRTVARLHARAKPCEQYDKGLRPPTDADATHALSCLKTVLIEFGWAR